MNEPLVLKVLRYMTKGFVVLLCIHPTVPVAVFSGIATLCYECGHPIPPVLGYVGCIGGFIGGCIGMFFFPEVESWFYKEWGVRESNRRSYDLEEDRMPSELRIKGFKKENG
jgi:hypothetical protein